VTVALVMTVRDEEALLRANLLYHHYMGVELAFIYSDGSTDGTLASVESLPFVHAGPSVGPDRAGGRPELARAVAQMGWNHRARKVLNAWDSMERARAAGCTWLLMIDADELVAPELVGAQPGAFSRLLEDVPHDVQCVRFPALEIVQRMHEYDKVFAQATLFKRSGARIRRRVLDPLRGRTVKVDGFYGHTGGKSAVRLTADAGPWTAHEFVGRDGSKLRTVAAGCLLHYYCYSFGSFLAKFRRFHDCDTYLSGAPLKPLKRLWRDVVNHPGFTEADLHAYYQAWVAFDEREIQRLRRSTWLGVIPRAPGVIEVTAPRRVFEALARSPVGALA
jgi:hypothetical protein